MNVLEAIKKRRSIRMYQEKAVEEKDLQELLYAAHLAPSGHNTQPWRFIVIKDAVQRETLAKLSHNQQWMATAPVYIAVCADLSARSETLVNFDEETPSMDAKRAIRDTAIAIDHLMLRAVELGLGTCWIGWYDQADVKPVLKVPEGVFVLGIIIVGHPAEDPAPRPRHRLANMVFKDDWGNPYVNTTN